MSIMNKIAKSLAAVALSACAVCATAQEPASVFITAGQSNADGREYVNKLPYYLKGGYKYLRYTNVTSSGDGTFHEFKFDKRFAFCDITNYFIEQSLQTEFYAIKCAYGGTAIDTAATYSHLPVWCADEGWIGRNNAYRGDINKGKSLTKSLTEGFAACADVTLSKLPQGYDVKAIMWHQGESDRKQAGHYYKNFKDMINYMRAAVYAKTGREKDKTLPFIFGTVPHASKQYSRGVEEAQLRVAAELPNVYCIDMSDAGLRSDALHFDSAWTEYLGKQMYNKLVELRLVDGDMVEAEKPHKPGASDTLQVEAERRWDFTEAWAPEAEERLKADKAWPMFQKLGYRYSSAMPENRELAASDGYVFPATKGLFFKCSTGNRIIVNPGNHICLYGDNLYLTVPKVSPGQTVTIVTESAKGERGITTDNADLVELVHGGGKATGKVVNEWRVKESLTGPVDLVFHSDGGAIYVYSIQVASPYVQILVGADGKVTFSSDKACDVRPCAGMIKAYVATDYDASSDVLTLQQVDTIPANTGVVVIGEECLVGAPQVKSAPAVARNLLVPVVGESAVGPTETVGGVDCCNYVLQSVGGSVDFHKLKAPILLSGQAYLRLPATEAAGAEVVRPVVDTGSGIGLVSAGGMARGMWYTIDGVAVERPSRGLYVCDGRKYLFK